MFLVSCFLALGLVTIFGSLFSQQTAGELFEKALYVEEAQGGLEKAVGLYQQILKKFSDNGEVCAKAQLKIGQCYEKLGNTEAVKDYELVLKNFADRPDEVAVARERLAALRQEAPPGAAVVNLPMRDARMSVEAISPDGTKLLGISEEGPDVVVYDTVKKQTTFITKFDQDREPLWAGSPVWSPDGTEIAYTVALDSINKKYEIRVSDLRGNSRHLWKTEGDNVWPMDWLPDGKWMAFVSTDTGTWQVRVVVRPSAGGADREFKAPAI